MRKMAWEVLYIMVLKMSMVNLYGKFNKLQ